MATQNKKFTTILLAGLFIGGAVAFGYACGGDDTSGTAIPGTGVGGSAGTAGSTGVGGGTGGDNTGGGGASNTGGGGSANPEGGAGTGMTCTAAGSYDNKPLNLPADGGLPAL